MLLRSALIAAALGMMAAAYSPAVRACELRPSVEFHLPVAGRPMPRNAALLARITAPTAGRPEVTLVRVEDDAPVPVLVEFETSTSNEVGYVLAAPLRPLEARTEYRWNVDADARTFVTTAETDEGPPVPGELTVAGLGEVIREGCFGEEVVFSAHTIATEASSEPVALMVFSGESSSWGDIVIGVPGEVTIERLPRVESCYQVDAVDYAGNRIGVDEVCFPAMPNPAGTDGSTGAGGTTGGAAESGGDGGTSGSTTTAGTGRGTAGSSGVISGSGSSGPASGMESQDGCGCTSGPGGSLSLWVMLLLFRRRSPIGPPIVARAVLR